MLCGDDSGVEHRIEDGYTPPRTHHPCHFANRRRGPIEVLEDPLGADGIEGRVAEVERFGVPDAELDRQVAPLLASLGDENRRRVDTDHTPSSAHYLRKIGAYLAQTTSHIQNRPTLGDAKQLISLPASFGQASRH
jgi:hypothetical protein